MGEKRKLGMKEYREKFDLYQNQFEDKSPQQVRDELDSQFGIVLDIPEPEMTAGDVALTGLDYTGRALDAQGGLVRGALGGIAEMFTDKNLVDAEEVARGQAPGFAEMAKRAGVPAGYSINEVLEKFGGEDPYQVPEMLNVTPRGAVGLGLDIATDPMTYETLGFGVPAKIAAKLAGKSKAVNMMGKAVEQGIDALPQGLKTLGQTGKEFYVNPAGKTLEAIGDFAYNSAFKKVDHAVKKYAGKGDKAVSSTLKKYNVWGSMENMAEKSEEIADNLFKQNDAELSQLKMYDSNNNIRPEMQGNTVDMEEAIREAKDYLQQKVYGDNPNLSQAQLDINKNDMLEDVGKYLDEKLEKFKMKMPKEAHEVTSKGDFNVATGRYDDVVQKVDPVEGVSIARANEMKSDLYKSLKDKDFQGDHGTLKAEVVGRLARGIREQTEKAIGKLDATRKAANKNYQPILPGILERNKDVGNLLTGKQSLAREVSKEVGTPLLGTTEVVLMSLGKTGPAAAVAAKRMSGGARFKTTAGRAATGLSKMGMGESPNAASNVLRAIQRKMQEQDENQENSYGN